ncbi:MAG: hypothetical protein LBS19_15015 [Clostridiales bacterium]|jgi:hypothetical protein|nr:hypothetical protein [Clostridiales bacterium]
MKKYLLIILVAALVCLSASGCQNKVKAQDEQAENAVYDFDLVGMNSNVIYALVYNMMMNPEEYVGKTIRTDGLFHSEYWEPTDNYYQYVLIPDAAACCVQGLEIIWRGGHEFPGDYPEENAPIIVAGMYKSYEEQGETYYYIDVSEEDFMLEPRA